MGFQVEASISESGSLSGGQGLGHRARLAAVGDRMWEETGLLVPCTAAGSWLTLRRTIPEEAGEPGGSSEEWVMGKGPWWAASPQPCPLPGMFIWAKQSPMFVPLEELPSVVPEVRIPSDY